MEKCPSNLFEREIRAQGYQHIAGIDEVGRGCLAGPVVAAAVILPHKHTLLLMGLNDSKLLTPKKRELICQEIYRQAVTVGIGSIEAHVIDEVNILEASIQAMKKALEGLKPPADFLGVDGNLRQISHLPQKSIIHGDRLCESIAAASIVAKVFRDNLMRSYAETYPHYGLENNKGYPTEEHLKALKQYGASKIHRLTFRGVA